MEGQQQPQEPTSSPTPVIFDHCKRVYDAMEKAAKPEKIDGETAMVYEGHLTKLFQSLHLSMPYYSAVLRHLREMDCAIQIRRGGGNAMSRWQLLREPDEEAFNARVTTKSPRDGWKASVEQQLRDQQKQINALTEALGLEPASAATAADEE